MAAPITYLKIQTQTGILDVPIYTLLDFPFSPLRINTSKDEGVFSIVEPTNSYPLRIMTANGIKAIDTKVKTGNAPILNPNEYYLSPTNSTLVDDTPMFVSLTATRGAGILFPFRNVWPNQSYTIRFSIDLNIRGNLASIQFHIWNKTKNVRLASNVIPSHSSVNAVFNLTGDFFSGAIAENDELAVEMYASGTQISTFTVYKTNFTVTQTGG